METGIGFVVGAVAGAIVSVVVAVLVYASRSARRKLVSAALAVPAPAAHAERRRTAGRDTMIVDVAEVRDQRLSRNIQEVRDLLLQLADVVGSTETASGNAARAFTSAKKAIHSVDSTRSSELAEAQEILMHEIEKVLRSNATLHQELDRANQGIALQRRQIEELRVQARVDALTNIPNRAAFDERLAEYIGLVQRTNLVFTLMLVDIDHFKDVNDAHGHVNGDRILRGVAARLTESIRSNDFAARYGGEEFAVIFPGTEIGEAQQVADRIRYDISKTAFRMDNTIVKVTVSGGLAEFRRSMTGEEVLSLADAALYQAKNAGRNRVKTAAVTTS